MDNSSYKTVKDFAEAAFVERKSEFIGYLKHVNTEEEAVSFIGEIRCRHRKATHNVYAYILREGNASRYSDDGEPQGTAGVPVLETLKKEGLTDICCVVTRYFGGILLGGGGLVRAYSHSAKIAVDASEIMEMNRCFPVEISSDYNLYGKINYVLPEFEVKTLDTEFTENVKIKLIVKEELLSVLLKKIADISNGQSVVTVGELSFENFA